MQEAPSAFGAYASHPSLGGEEARGRIVFQNWRLRFEAPTGALEIPLTRLQIEMEKSAGGRIDFRDPQQPEWVIYTFDADILGHSALRQQACTRRQIQAIQSSDELKWRLKATLGVVIGFGIIALVVSVMMGVMARSAVARIPPAWEQELGTNLMQEVRQHVVFVEDPKLKAKLDLAVAPLLSVLPTNAGPFKFYIVQERFPNAFALPGGHVLVNTALLDLADRPEEIAGVVAHEIAHVTQKHGFRKIISEGGPYLVFRVFLGGQSGVLGLLGGSSQLLIQQGFSQQFELEADAVGWDSLVAARIDPRGLTEMLKKLELTQANALGGDPRINAFESHPATEKRIARLEAKWQKLASKSGFIDLAAETKQGP